LKVQTASDFLFTWLNGKWQNHNQKGERIYIWPFIGCQGH
jgi:hypothetical protein